MKFSWALTLFIFFLSQEGVAGGSSCSQVDAQAAEKEASGLKSWESLYVSYNLYKHCDDGAISEGYTESVTRLLIENWNQFGVLCGLERKDKEFGYFVVRHVNALMSPLQAKKIYLNVTYSCPNYGGKVCDSIKNKIDELIYKKEIGFHDKERN